MDPNTAIQQLIVELGARAKISEARCVALEGINADLAAKLEAALKATKPQPEKGK